jgi:recA bacterial DNA recombination protein
MPATARATLEALLRDRKLDTTLTAAFPLSTPESERIAATGIPVFDETAGGMPRGQISEIVGAVSSGRTAFLTACLAEATRRGELVALVDALDRFDPPSAAAAGVELDRLLWIRGGEGDRTRVVSRAIKALNLVLSAGGFGVVALDVGDVSLHALRALPFTTWLRLQRVIAGSDTACVLVASAPLARSSGGSSVRLEPRVPTSTAFHQRVIASRRPFLDASSHRPGAVVRTAPHVSSAVWAGDARTARRLRGLAVQAHIQTGLRSMTRALEFTGT